MHKDQEGPLNSIESLSVLERPWTVFSEKHLLMHFATANIMYESPTYSFANADVPGLISMTTYTYDVVKTSIIQLLIAAHIR